ncbi:MAG: 50S ribosomal protein L22 [Patescibacteria group bacterium]
MITASLNNYRQSPRKVRLVANLIKGKKVSDALLTLKFLTKSASNPISRLLSSAVANAKNNFNLDSNSFVIKEMRVDGGSTLKRRMPRARGMAYQIKKRTSNITLVLDEKK